MAAIAVQLKDRQLSGLVTLEVTELTEAHPVWTGAKHRHGKDVRVSKSHRTASQIVVSRDPPSDASVPGGTKCDLRAELGG